MCTFTNGVIWKSVSSQLYPFKMVYGEAQVYVYEGTPGSRPSPRSGSDSSPARPGRRAGEEPLTPSTEQQQHCDCESSPCHRERGPGENPQPGADRRSTRLRGCSAARETGRETGGGSSPARPGRQAGEKSPSGDTTAEATGYFRL